MAGTTSHSSPYSSNSMDTNCCRGVGGCTDLVPCCFSRVLIIAWESWRTVVSSGQTRTGMYATPECKQHVLALAECHVTSREFGRCRARLLANTSVFSVRRDLRSKSLLAANYPVSRAVCCLFSRGAALRSACLFLGESRSYRRQHLPRHLRMEFLSSVDMPLAWKNTCYAHCQ